MSIPNRIDPPDCACTECITGHSTPLRRWGSDEHFAALVHGQAVNATGRPLGELHHLLDEDGQQLFLQFLHTELTEGRLVSRLRIESKALARVLGDLFD